MKVFVLGTGPAGLAVAHGLSEDPRIEIILIDALPQVGGLAQTLVWEGQGAHDLGPHKLFTLNKELNDRVHALLPRSEWLTQPKRSRIYINGYYLPYPPSPFSLINVFGVPKFTQMVAGFGLSKIGSIFRGGRPTTFEQDLTGRLGRRLYEVLFKPIALKLWGDPADLDSKLSEGRVQTPSLFQVILKTLGFKKATQTAEALEFDYPRGGLQNLWNAIVHGLPNATVLLNHKVVGFELNGKRVTGLRLLKNGRDQSTLSVGPDDFIMSSIPLTSLPALMGSAVPEETRRAINDIVVLNDLLLVFLSIDRPRLIPDSWIFVPDPMIAFHRLSEQASFDPSMSPKGSIVCCEIMSHALRPFTNKSDAELRAICIEGLRAMKIDVSGSNAWPSRVIRLPATYPVYRPRSSETLNEILRVMDSFENFRTIGRQGSFNYIGSLDAMDVGYGAARWFRGRTAGGDARTWAQERERTLLYPVLD